MTDDDATKIKGQVVEDLNVLHQRARCLIAKAETMIGVVSQGQTFLSSLVDDDENGVPVNDPPLPPEALWPSYESLKEIGADIRHTHTKIKKLTERLRGWEGVQA